MELNNAITFYLVFRVALVLLVMIFIIRSIRKSKQ